MVVILKPFSVFSLDFVSGGGIVLQQAKQIIIDHNTNIKGHDIDDDLHIARSSEDGRSRGHRI